MFRCHLTRMMGESTLLIADILSETGLSRNTVTSLYDEISRKVDLDIIYKLLGQVCADIQVTVTS